MTTRILWTPLALAGSVALALPPQALAQAGSASPFGLRMGMSLAELSQRGNPTPLAEVPFSYTMTSVPVPHPAFESYSVTVTQGDGLCKVMGIGKTLDTNSFGTEIQSAFDELEQALARKYGRHKKFDFVQAGSIWNEPRDWMSGLRHKERTLSAYWDAEEKSSLPPDLTSIALHARALSGSTGFLIVGYEFTNFTSCQQQLKRRRDSGL